MPDRMPEDMPDRMPDRMPEDMSDRMPDRMPEDLPDRMPEGMPGSRGCCGCASIATASLALFRCRQICDLQSIPE